MDEEDIPDTSDVSSREACSILLVMIATISGFASLASSLADLSRGYAGFAIAAGLGAIALAILSVGQNMNRDD